VDLEEKNAGRLVVAGDAVTVAVSIAREGDEWRILPDRAQRRQRPPEPGDQDGLLGGE
jgi:hypothetical protein